MKIYDDESINSYLFRCLHVYGINSFQSVIGNNGLWHSLPQAPVQLVSYLKMVPDLTLFKSLQREGYFNCRGESRKNPLEAIKLLHRVYGGSHRISNAKGTGEILFCPECFENMFIELGHTYFRVEWKRKKDCSIHHVPLLRITGSYLKESVNNILNIMTVGASQKNSCDVISHHVNQKVHIRPSLVEPMELKFIMPCIFDATTFFVREFYSSNSKLLRFKSYIYSGLFYKSQTPKMYGINVPIMKDVNEDIIYAAMKVIKEMDYSAWLSFDKYAKIEKMFAMGFNEKNSLSVTTVKNSNANCSKCYIHSRKEGCVYSCIISREKLEPNFNRWHFINPCEQRINLGFNVF